MSPVAQATQGQCSTTNYDGTRFVIRGNQVTLKGSFEKNQRVALKVIKKNKLTPQIEDVKYVFPLPGASLQAGLDPAVGGTPGPVMETCSLSNPTQTTDKTTKQSLITKFKDNCNYEFVYNIALGCEGGVLPTGSPRPDCNDGSQNNELDLNNYYDFSFYPIDKAGNVPIPSGPNTSIQSSTLTLYHDKVKPNIPINSPPCLDNTTPTNPIINPNGIPNGNNNQNLCTSPLTTINYNQPDKIMLGCEGAVLATGSPRPDCNQLNSYNQYDITNQTNIEIKTTGERQSDLQQQLGQKPNQVVNAITTNPTENKLELTPDSTTNLGIRDDNNNLITDTTQLNQTRILKMGNTGTYSDNISTFNLGKATTDEADSTSNPNCIQTSSTPIKNRRVGTCNNGDGLYNILERNIDTTGNRGSWVSKVVERDTVSPGSPVANTSTTNGVRGGISSSKFGQWLNLSITGEGYTSASVIISNDDGLRIFREYKLDSNGAFSLNNIIGQLSCGRVTYSLEVYLKDRAGNISQRTIQNNFLTTDFCGQCTTTGSGIMRLPVDAGTTTTTGLYPRYQGTTGAAHAGMDFGSNSGSGGQNIYAVDSGTVTKAYYGYTDDYPISLAGSGGRISYAEKNARGWANVVIIDHGNGIQTIYAHLKPETNPIVTVGQSITKGQIIGKMGTTGSSTGPHLHFQIEQQGAVLNPLHEGKYNRWAPVNPANFLPVIATNYTPAEETVSCTQAFGNTDENEYLPEITEDQARLAAALYIKNELNDDSYIERHDSRITSKETNPAITDINNPNYYTSEYTKKGKLGANKDNLEFLKQFVDVYQVKPNIWLHNMGKADQKYNGQMNQGDIDNNRYDALDSGIVVNNYNVQNNSNKQAYIIKNGIWDKFWWDTPIEKLGVPTGDEVTNFESPSLFPQFQDNEAWRQNFRLGSYQNNAIYFCSIFKDGYCPVGNGGPISESTSKSFYVVGKVAQYYSESGRVTEFGLPKQDTQKVNTQGKDNYCKQEFSYKYIDYCRDIETILQVSAINSDAAGILKNGNVLLNNTNGDVADRYNRKIKLEIVDYNGSNDRQNYQYGYKDDKNIWIISHGWNDTPASFKDIAQSIKRQNPDDIVLLLDWSEASNNDNGQCLINCPIGVNRAATWIKPVADSVTNLLNIWGFDSTKGNNLRVVGHSLGSIMSGEISYNFQNKARTLIALDPPSETFDASITDSVYKVKQNPNQYRKNFDQYAQFSRSFVGNNSLAGNKGFARTANESFVLDFGNLTDIGGEHGNVVKTFENIVKDDNNTSTNDGFLYNNYLDTKDIPINSNPNYNSRYLIDGTFTNGFKGRIAVDDMNNSRSYAQQLIGIRGDRNQIFGSTNNNRLNQKDTLNQSRDIPDKNTDIWGGNGNDVFFANNEDSTKETFVKDFNNSGDRVNLLKERKTNTGSFIVGTKYNIDQTNSTTATKYITRSLCFGNLACTLNQYVNDHTNAVVEGGRVGGVTQTELESKINELNSGRDTDWFIKR